MGELRHNGYGGSHHYVSPGVLETEEEWRKQSIHFARARGITLEEVAMGAQLRPDILKTWWSAGFLPARPNYGRETQMLSWPGTAFNWNCNEAPRLKVKSPNDPKSRESLVRRVDIIEYWATFSANPALVSKEKLVFPDDSELKALWCSPLGRFILWTDHWIPFMNKVSLSDARKILSCPSSKQKALREQFVKEMVGADEGKTLHCNRTMEPFLQRRWPVMRLGGLTHVFELPFSYIGFISIYIYI